MWIFVCVACTMAWCGLRVLDLSVKIGGYTPDMNQNGATPSLLPPEPERTFSGRAWAIAAASILLILTVAVFATLRRGGNKTDDARPTDVNASQLAIAGLELSEATNGTGGKAFYVDGTLHNTGSRTLKDATVQVTFASAEGKPPHRESLLLALVRTREPYVDLQPVSAAPVHAGEERQFRLIFDAVPADWDMKVPDVRIVHATLQ